MATISPRSASAVAFSATLRGRTASARQPRTSAPSRVMTPRPDSGGCGGERYPEENPKSISCRSRPEGNRHHKFARRATHHALERRAECALGFIAERLGDQRDRIARARELVAGEEHAPACEILHGRFADECLESQREH